MEPDNADIIATASSLNIHLTEEQAVEYRRYVVKYLAAFDEFVQSRTEELPPPGDGGARDVGFRPRSESDQHNAWLWKCRIDGSGIGVLAGKTVSFKDHIAVRGIPLTFGSFMMDGFIPDFDASVVTRVLAEGGTIIGKNTMNGPFGGFGFGGGIGDFWGARNPRSADHLPGGSSSGSAAAVVSGEVDVAFGGDQAGSVRVPAAWCGAVGLKPSFGLVSHFGAVFGTEPSVDHIGPLALKSADVAAALQAVGGFDPLDPRQGRDVPARIDALSNIGQGVSGLRIGLVEEGLRGSDPSVHSAVVSALDALSGEGAQIARVSIPAHLAIPAAVNALLVEGGKAVFDCGFFGAFAKTYYPGSLIAAIDKVCREDTNLLAPRGKASYLLAEFSRRNFHGRVYAKAQNVRPLFVDAYNKALAEFDVLVMPTCLTTAPQVEAIEDPLRILQVAINYPGERVIDNTVQFNYTGHPALAVPCGTSGGLPVSMQLVGRLFDDPLLLRVANTYEHAVNWQNIECGM